MAKDWIFITNIPNSAKPRSVSIEEKSDDVRKSVCA